jgi:hypothetical protein
VGASWGAWQARAVAAAPAGGAAAAALAARHSWRAWPRSGEGASQKAGPRWFQLAPQQPSRPAGRAGAAQPPCPPSRPQPGVGRCCATQVESQASIRAQFYALRLVVDHIDVDIKDIAVSLVWRRSLPALLAAQLARSCSCCSRLAGGGRRLAVCPAAAPAAALLAPGARPLRGRPLRASPEPGPPPLPPPPPPRSSPPTAARMTTPPWQTWRSSTSSATTSTPWWRGAARAQLAARRARAVHAGEACAPARRLQASAPVGAAQAERLRAAGVAGAARAGAMLEASQHSRRAYLLGPARRYLPVKTVPLWSTTHLTIRLNDGKIVSQKEVWHNVLGLPRPLKQFLGWGSSWLIKTAEGLLH